MNRVLREVSLENGRRRSHVWPLFGRAVAAFSVAILLVVAGVTSAQAVTGTLSVSVGSIGRDAASKLTFDVTATADGVQGSGRVCPSASYSCSLSFYAQREDGSSIFL
ncbi:MAG: hypothetical protein ACTHJI_12795, partial [Leifsonia sp.]